MTTRLLVFHFGPCVYDSNGFMKKNFCKMNWQTSKFGCYMPFLIQTVKLWHLSRFQYHLFLRWRGFLRIWGLEGQYRIQISIRCVRERARPRFWALSLPNLCMELGHSMTEMDFGETLANVSLSNGWNSKFEVFSWFINSQTLVFD